MNKHFLLISNEKVILKLYDTDINNAYKVLDSIKDIYRQYGSNITLINAEIPNRPMKHIVR